MTRRIRVWGITIGGLLILMATCAAAQARESEPIDPAGIDSLTRDSGGTARVTIHPVTGAARLVQLDPGRLRLLGADPAARAADFLRRYGRIFGIGDPATDLALTRERVDRLGMTHIRYSQRYRGVPVFAGELRAHFGPAGGLRLVHGTVVPGISLDPNPTRSSSDAAAIAVAHVRGLYDAPLAAPVAAKRTALMVFRSGLVRRVEGRNHLVFEVEVANGAGVREVVYVDAHTGKVVDRITGIHDLITRQIHEPAFNPPVSVIWDEGDPPYNTGNPTNDTQVNRLIDVSKDVYDFYKHLSGDAFLSWDGTDGTMHSVWNIPSTPQIPCPNAFWDGAVTNFCDGVTPDDVVGHEWTHAYTDRTHALIYQWQSGALNEAYSDMFGESVDLLNGTGTDSPGPPRTDGQCSTFGGSPPLVLAVNAPAGIAGDYPAAGAGFNPAPPVTVTRAVELVNDGSGTVTDGCQALVGFTAGRIALIDRGSCPFVTKALNAENASAGGVVIVNNAGDGLITMSGAGSLTIPSLFIGQSNGALIKGQLGAGVNASISLDVSSDGSLRWLLGEDSTAFGGSIRDMWNPTCFGDPGKVSDTLFYVCSTSDSGGVHTNSGVPNHAFTLLADGGQYNGATIAALGLTKTSHIYWRAMEIYQVADSDFNDHADALDLSCSDLLGVNLADLATGSPSGEILSAGDCAEVSEAMLAVEMRTPPTFCNFASLLDPAAPAPNCGVEVFSDDFETDPTSSWTRTNAGVNAEYTPRDWEWTETVPPGGSGSAFFALDSLTLGNCIPGSDDQSGAMQLDSPLLSVPTDLSLLTFDHYVATEAGWDGGNVKISVNGGAFQTIAAGDFIFNTYNATLVDAGSGNTNPLEGQPGFTGSNGGELKGSWGQSQIDLAPYAGVGDTFRLRFEFGVDGCNGLDGWYVDNVRVCNDCSGLGATDADFDGSRTCDLDCNDSDPDTFPGALEANDGLDNQCPEDAGFGLVDEISGVAGSHDRGPGISTISWNGQVGATLYQVARSTTPDFSAGCSVSTTVNAFILDSDPLDSGDVYYYLMRPLTPNVGSWGVDSTGTERLSICGL